MDAERLAELARIPDPRLAGANGGIFFDANGPDVTEVLLIRHGHIPIVGPADDPHLTDIGFEQAAALGEFLARQKPLTAIYSSPLLRTLDTANAIASRQLLTVETLHDIREIETYVPAGTSLREHVGEAAWEAYAETMRRTRRWDARGELSESSDSLRSRAVNAVESVIARHPGGRIALVTHGPVLLSYFAATFDSPFDMLFQPRLTSISSVVAKGADRRVMAINTVPHFGIV